MLWRTTAAAVFVALLVPCAKAASPDLTAAELDKQFGQTIQPFVNQYCAECHTGQSAKGDLNLKLYSEVATVVKDQTRWAVVREKLSAQEMPPPEATQQPTLEVRQQIIAWIDALRKSQSDTNAGDPGIVLARRLSNAEFDYAIRDLTGFDLHPTREFPLDPANTAGFDNSGESLTMSPALLTKYLKAAHEVADHMFLKPDGFAFAATPMLVETDRDQYCVQQIIALYHRQNTDYADYFQAAWRFNNRALLGRPQATLADFAADGNVSAKYLSTVWSMIEEEKEEVGPLVKLQTLWKALPAPAADKPDVARDGCEQMRDYIVQFRKKVEPRFLNITMGGSGGRGGGGGGGGGQAILLWKNIQYATHRMTFDPSQLQVDGEPPTPPLDVANEPNAAGEFGPGRTVPVINTPGDPDLVVPAGQRAKYEAAFAKFCKVFPDKFYMEERGRNYFNTKIDRGRFLSAGFHSDMGYFRDDQPLHDLILDDKQQKELDDLWFLFDFMGEATARMYVQSGGGRPVRGGSPATKPDGAVEVAMVAEPPTSENKVKQAEARFLAQATNPVAQEAGKVYYEWMNSTFRAVEKARVEAVPRQLEAMQQFAARAYRRPLTENEKTDLTAYYTAARQKDGLDNEEAMRETLVAILMSPDLTYRTDMMASEKGIHPLSDFDLASRLSFFLWSSIPDEELIAHAKAGNLHDLKVLTGQTRRMLKDKRSRALAVEFGGNWLEFRHFEQLSSVDKERFSTFTKDLQDAMFEEPVRFLLDVIQQNRPVLDMLYANDTFVNPALAKHYGIPTSVKKADEWEHIADASRYERGGLLPMAAFLTQNSPGLRTSPVKRGNWVVKNIFGERIPPPPPNVPELPRDESKLELPLRDMLARHRADPSCSSCHERIDSFGLVFEGFGPTGEHRDKDLAGRPIDTSATFPGGAKGSGINGLRQYIRDKRQDNFIDNLCGKLLAYALGRSPIASDDAIIQEMRSKLTSNGYRFESMVESIITSRQFLTKRGQDAVAER